MLYDQLRATFKVYLLTKGGFNLSVYTKRFKQIFFIVKFHNIFLCRCHLSEIVFNFFSDLIVVYMNAGKAGAEQIAENRRGLIQLTEHTFRWFGCFKIFMDFF